MIPKYITDSLDPDRSKMVLADSSGNSYGKLLKENHITVPLRPNTSTHESYYLAPDKITIKGKLNLSNIEESIIPTLPEDIGKPEPSPKETNLRFDLGRVDEFMSIFESGNAEFRLEDGSKLDYIMFRKLLDEASANIYRDKFGKASIVTTSQNKEKFIQIHKILSKVTGVEIVLLHLGSYGFASDYQEVYPVNQENIVLDGSPQIKTQDSFSVVSKSADPDLKIPAKFGNVRLGVSGTEVNISETGIVGDKLVLSEQPLPNQYLANFTFYTDNEPKELENHQKEVAKIIEFFPESLKTKVKNWKNRLSKYKSTHTNPYEFDSQKQEILEIVKEIVNFIQISSPYGDNKRLNLQLLQHANNTSKTILAIAQALDKQENLSCYPANYLFHAILEYLEIQSVIATGYHNQEDPENLTQNEAHAFTVVNIAMSNKDNTILIVDATPNRRESESSSDGKIFEIKQLSDLKDFVVKTLDILSTPEVIMSLVGIIFAVICTFIAVKEPLYELAKFMKDLEKVENPECQILVRDLKKLAKLANMINSLNQEEVNLLDSILYQISKTKEMYPVESIENLKFEVNMPPKALIESLPQKILDYKNADTKIALQKTIKYLENKSKRPGQKINLEKIVKVLKSFDNELR